MTASWGKQRLNATEQSLVDDMLTAYARGWFPMYDPDAGVTQWVQPMTRGVIPLESDRFRVSRSLRAVARSRRFRITSDTAFSGVIRACADEALRPEGTWICEDIVDGFELLHLVGSAHSVEAWRDTAAGPVLVGGLYGLAIGSAFCGESMFCRPELGGTDASKVCLVHLVEHLRAQGFTLLDAQLTNSHLEQFGCYEMDQQEYAELLQTAAGATRNWGVLKVAGVPRTLASTEPALPTTCSSQKPPPPCTGTQNPTH